MVSKIAVCVATLGRPEGLNALLESLSSVIVPPGYDCKFVVVDNDSHGSSRGVVNDFRGRLPGELIYDVEPHRGIPFARNRAIRAAGSVDWVAFVDDDEVVEPEWLDALIGAALQYGADVATGPVLPVFATIPPTWVSAGRFFERERHATGTHVAWARTSNALVASRLLPPAESGPFSEAMRNNGGDDTHFFQRVRLAGGRMVWADDAVVHETIPSSRVSIRWLLRRAYRRGNTLSLCLRDLEDSLGRRVKRLARAFWHALVGLGYLLSAPVAGRAGAVKGLQEFCFASGLVTGLGGVSYQEYRTVHGR